MQNKIIKLGFDKAIDALVGIAYDYANIDFVASDFYCGITNNIKRREREHNANFLIAIDAPNVEIAKGIERVMNEKGFMTGKVANGVSDDSTFVYLYLITPYTNQLEDE